MSAEKPINNFDEARNKVEEIRNDIGSDYLSEIIEDNLKELEDFIEKLEEEVNESLALSDEEEELHNNYSDIVKFLQNPLTVKEAFDNLNKVCERLYEINPELSTLLKRLCIP